MIKRLPLLFMFLLVFGCAQVQEVQQTPQVQQVPRQLPVTVIPITNFHQVVGIWRGMITGKDRLSISYPIEVTIDRFGHYEFKVTRPGDLFSGTGNFTIRNGRLVARAQDGYATFTLFEEGNKFMLVVLARMVEPAGRYNANLFLVK